MKTYLLPIILVSVAALQACDQKTSSATADAPVAPASEPAAPSGAALETTEQRLSYGIAFGLGQRMRTDGMPLDVDAFQMGLLD